VSKREKPFNNPFGNLKLKTPEKPAAKPVPVPPAKKAATPTDEDEAALFLASVGEVEPVRRGAPVTPPSPSAPPLPQRMDPEVEALTELAELVAGTGALSFADLGESIEASAQGLDPRILKRLRAGDYPIQGHIDLHGMTRVEARDALVRFIVEARAQKKRCVRVVHGKGLHSPDQLGVLKETAQAVLGRGKLAEGILAFTSARPKDGGTGALYVLLRR